MAIIPQYHQGKLASSVVGTPGVDRSGSIMLNSAMDAQQSLQQGVLAANGQAGAGVNHLLNIGEQVIGNIANQHYQEAQRIAAHKQAQVDAQAAKVQSLFDLQQAGTAQTAIHQKYLDWQLDLGPDTDWGAASQKLPALADQWAQEASNMPNLSVDAQAKIQTFKQSKVDEGLNFISSQARSSTPIVGHQNVLEGLSNLNTQAESTGGDPTKLKGVMDILNGDEVSRMVAPAVRGKDIPKLMDTQAKAMTTNAWSAGLRSARNINEFTQKAGGDILGGLEAQAADLAKKREYLNDPVYAHMGEQKLLSWTSGIDAMIAANKTATTNAVKNLDAKTYSTVSSFSPQINQAIRSGDAQSLNSISTQLEQMQQNQFALPENRQDKELQSHLQSMSNAATRGFQDVVSGKYSEINATHQAHEYDTSVYNSQIQTDLGNAARNEAATKKRNEELLKTAPARAAAASLGATINKFDDAISAVPQEKRQGSYVPGTGLNAQQFIDASKRVEDLYSKGWINLQDENRFRSAIDSYRDQVLPTTVAKDNPLKAPWDPSVNDYHKARTANADPGFLQFLNLAPTDPGALKLGASYRNEFDNEMQKIAGNQAEAQKLGGPRSALAVETARIRANQAVTRKYMEVPFVKQNLPSVVVPAEKPKSGSITVRPATLNAAAAKLGYNGFVPPPEAVPIPFNPNELHVDPNALPPLPPSAFKKKPKK